MTEIEFYKRIVPEFEYFEEVYYMFKELIETDTLQVNCDCSDSDSLINEFKLQIVREIYPYCVEVDESIYDEIDDLLISNADCYLSYKDNNCYYIDIEQLQSDIKALADELDCECNLVNLKDALLEMNKNYPAKFVN